jgi:GDP-L-fucose synthase
VIASATGCGEDLTISELARVVCDVVGFKGEITHDLMKPDGAPRKLMDTSRLTALGWQYKTKLPDGLRDTYAGFLAQEAAAALKQ